MTDLTDATRPSPHQTYRRPGQLTLRVVSGPTPSQPIVVAKDRIVIGRSRTADLVLDHPSVSSAHVELRVGSQGIEVRDLGSTNGTRIGRVSILHVRVEPGAIIAVGDCEVLIASVGEIEAPISSENRLGPMLGSSATIREVFARIRKIAATPLDVLITGETGTGKELATRAIHSLSDRSKRSMVTLDCSTLAKDLIEATIFGYRKGAYTGALADTAGYVETADGSTLFLDEIGELPLDLQAKLLRVLDLREVTRLGETRARTVDIRVVAATNRDLIKMVADGLFREDLYHRMSRARIELPPLRRRREDIYPLAQFFVDEVARARDVKIELHDKTKELLENYPWPGNVRELLNAMRYAAHTVEGSTITLEDIILGGPLTASEIDRLCALPYKKAHFEFDRVYLPRALRAAKGIQAVCARNIDIARSTLRRHLKTMNMFSIDDLEDD